MRLYALGVVTTTGTRPTVKGGASRRRRLAMTHWGLGTHSFAGTVGARDASDVGFGCNLEEAPPRSRCVGLGTVGAAWTVGVGWG